MHWGAVFASAVFFAIGCSSRTSDISSEDGREPTAIRLGRILDDNPIPAENQRPGNPEWRNGWRADARQLEVYLSTVSQTPGNYVAVKVSVDGPSQIMGEVYRLGYYGGAGARRVWSDGPFSVSTQPTCPRDADTGRVECDWDDTFYFRLGTDWVSGLYLVKVTKTDSQPYKRFAPFVVRDGRPAELLLKAAFNTYQAYNNWGGESCYQDSSGMVRAGHATEVSFSRPYTEGEGASQALYSELVMLQLLEQRGYDVTYATNIDYLWANPLQGIGTLVIPGHDEYWTVEERRQVDMGVASGQTSLAHFSANGSYWRVRFLDDRRGNPFRTMVCYKGSGDDPIPGSTSLFRAPPDPNPETNLFGVGYEAWQIVSYPLVVRDASHWIFQGTGIADGEVLPELIGVEFDRVWPEIGIPAGLHVIAESPLITSVGIPSRSHMVERTLAAGNLVFSGGSIAWPSGLAMNLPFARDERVVRMALNVIERSLAHRRPSVEPAAPGPTRPDSPIIVGEWARSVAPLAGTPTVEGWQDGPGDSALFSRPSGVAIAPSGKIVVADPGNSLIRLVDTGDAHTVTTIAGTGRPGTADGVPGAQAMFNKPSGVAVDSTGAIYVADTENQVIRRIENDPPVYSVSTHAGGMQQVGFRDSPDPVQARFAWPFGLAIDSQNNLFVTDRNNRVRMIRAGSREVITYAGNGYAGLMDSPVGTAASFSAPSAIAVGPSGHVYVLDGSTQYIRRISPSGTHAVDTLTGPAPETSLNWAIGYVDGPGPQALFRGQLGMGVNRTGEILLADTANYRIRKIVPGDSADSTRVSTIAGSGRGGTQLGSGDASDIPMPSGIGVMPDGTVIVSDSFNHVLRQIFVGP